MRHRVQGRTFGRRPEQRKALFRGLANSLLDEERIETTLQKAKELRRVVEPLVTWAKRGDLHARRLAASYLYRKETLHKLFSEVAERFKDRAGGYTRIYRIGRRRGDGADMALIELIPGDKKAKPSKTKTEEKKSEKKVEKKAAPKAEKPAKEKKAEKKAAPKKKAEKKS